MNTQQHDINHVNTGGKMTKYTRTNDKMIAGVCGLIAKETGIDVGLVRIIAAVLGVVSSGIVVVAYLIAWAVLPAEGQSTTLMDKAVSEGQKFYDNQKAKKAAQPSAQPGPAAQTPPAQPTSARNGAADPDPFDLYKED
ncbi:PspC domain-containing protein [Propionibacteriaceae bacterium Y1923]|uniref:PspC domain-containing protein n=1 Tax=Aestuariimicrobium sp. Y1814 TaxID=3418742 RepID=UPI003C160491